MTIQQKETPIRKVSDYFGTEEVPTIGQQFTPGIGWIQPATPEPISHTKAMALQRQGVKAVALQLGTRLADFQISELTPKVGLRVHN